MKYYLSILFLVFPFSYNLFSSEYKNKEKVSGIKTHTSIPEGSTLPIRVLRINTLYRSLRVSSIYNSVGKRELTGFNNQISLISPIIEYGLTDNLSLQSVFPIITKNYFTIDKKVFLRSSLYRKIYNNKLKKTAKNLQDKTQGQLFNDEEDCKEAILRGFSLPITSKEVLDTGENIYNLSNVPIRDQIEDIILNNVESKAKSGSLGLGDIQLGLLYKLFRSNKSLFSLGAGLRVPSSNYDIPQGMRPLSRDGFFDLGVRFNFAISPFEGLWVSSQHQAEKSINTVNKRVTKILDTKELSNVKSECKKIGYEIKNLVKFNFGCGVIHPYLKSISVNCAYHHEKSREIKFFNAVTPADKMQLISVGSGVSGLPYGLPFSADITYMTPISGKEGNLVKSTLDTSIKLYYKF